MRWLIASAIILASATVATAQQFVPFTIDLPTFQQLSNLLGDVPSKYANPIINILTSEAIKAQREAAAKAEAEKMKKSEPKHESGK